MKENNIRNIIFDLGGVIVDIEPDRALVEFSRLSGKTREALHQIIVEGKQLFMDYETGMIDSLVFRTQLSALMNCELKESDFTAAWNSIIFDIPAERVAILRQLAKKYRLFLLSNTNDLHSRRVEEIIAASDAASGLFTIFEKVYYSFRIHKKKPEPSVYRRILEENQLEPSQTLFIDDLPENIEGAKTAGLQVLHVVRNKPVFDLLL